MPKLRYGDILVKVGWSWVDERTFFIQLLNLVKPSMLGKQLSTMKHLEQGLMWSPISHK
jgi:hypothetical protein